MTFTDTLALLRTTAAVAPAAAWDVKANKPLPPASGQDFNLLVSVQAAKGLVQRAQAFADTHPGVYWALFRLLTTLSAAKGRPWAAMAAEALALLVQIPPALSEAAIWLPRAEGMLEEFQPAAIGIVGDRR